MNKYQIARHGGKGAIECERLCCTRIENFSVTRSGKRILDNVNLHIHCGELTALIGPNGAGKTTLLKALLGEIKHSGSLKYLDAKGKRSGKPLIGYVPQNLDLDNGAPVSVLDLFTTYLGNKPCWWGGAAVRDRALADLEMVKAAALIDERLGTLSGGELQRVLLALALDPLPDLLLLDEPVSGVDNSGMELFYEIVADLRKRHDLSIILVSHDLALVAKHADRVALLDKTVLCVGDARAVFNDARTRAIFKLLPAVAER